MDRCANTEALNKYMDEQEAGETAVENFLSDIEDELEEMEELIARIKDKAKTYEGYDLDEEIKTAVMEYL